MTSCSKCLGSWLTGLMLRKYPWNNLQVWRHTLIETQKIKFAGMRLQGEQIFLTTVGFNVLKGCFNTLKILEHFNYIIKKYFIFNKEPFLMVGMFFKKYKLAF